MSNKKIRVCFLGRVSTKYESQDSSIINQKDMIVNLIKSKDNELFDEEQDCFEDRVSGVKLYKGNNNTKGFDELMRLLNLDIVDTNNEDYTELKIKADKSKEPYYKKIYASSTSRVTRAGSAGTSLLLMLKKIGVEVWFYNLNRGTFELSDMELTLYNYMDNQYSKNQSYNTRMNKILKTKNRELMLHNVRFGWDLVKVNGKRKYIINQDEKAIYDLIVKLLLEDDLGCDLISQRLEQLGLTSTKIQLDKHSINRILKNKHYLGLEKYYQYPSDYASQFLVDRSYLANLNYDWLPCEYIEPLIDQETFDKVQEKLQSRSNCNRGFRHPYLPITKKLVCASCGANFYSIGASNYYNEQGFKCSSKRSKKAILKKPCNNNTFYINHFEEWQEKQAKNLPLKMNEIHKQAIFDMLYLEHHLALLLAQNNDDEFETLTNREDELTEQLETKIALLLKNSTTETMDIILKFQQEISNELKEVREKINTYLDLKNIIIQAIREVKKIQSSLDEMELNIKSKYTKEEFLDEIEVIYVYPINEKRRKNSVLFLPLLKVEVQIFDLISSIMDSDIIKLLPPNTIYLSTRKYTKKYNVKELSNEEMTKARHILERLEL